MTEAENEKRKLILRQALYDGIRVEQHYPNVETIEIIHERFHSSAFGRSQQNGVWKISPKDDASFVLDCLNPECSTIGFDLRSIISSAVRDHKTEVYGEMLCSGQEAPDHPEQSCDGLLRYTIRIVYK